MKLSRKYIGLFLLLIASIPTLLIILFSTNKIYIRKKMKAKLEKEILVSIQINSRELQWIKKDKEILFEGRLFDIKSIQLKGDSYFITGLFDDDETALIKNFEKHQRNGNSSEGITLIYTQLVHLLQSVYIETLDPDLRIATDIIHFYSSAFIALPKLFKPVLTPPPQTT